MAAEVVVYTHRSRQRPKLIAQAMYNGIKRAGGEKVHISSVTGTLDMSIPVAVFYGLSGPLAPLFEQYKARAAEGYRAVYIDLGYWGRRAGGTFMGYHKVSVNARHPTRYFQARQHGSDRAGRLGLELTRNPNHHADAILLAGMGAKAAIYEGYQPEQWERVAIQQIRQHTDRPIYYRPKPSWKEAQPIDGTVFAPAPAPLDELLSQCYAVVTHHSNVACDGLLAGVPCLVWDGVATVLGHQEFRDIERPRLPSQERRQQWLQDVAYCQWTLEEMREGRVWRHLKDEGLL